MLTAVGVQFLPMQQAEDSLDFVRCTLERLVPLEVSVIVIHSNQ